MPAFGQSREDKLNELKELPKPKTFKTAETNTPPLGNVAIMNAEQKKKPHNIQINNNAKQPKINPNIKYTDKHRYKRYKTKIEPKLHNKIEVNEEDDIVNKIKDAFGIASEKPNTNYSEEITAPAPFNNGVDAPPEVETNIYSNPNVGRIPERRSEQEDLLDDIMDISQNEAEELTLQARPKNLIQTDLHRYFQSPVPKLSVQKDLDKYFNPPFSRMQDDSQEADLKDLLTQIKPDDEPQSKARLVDSSPSLTPDEATRRLQYNLRKRIGRKEAKALKEDLAAARILNNIEPEYKDLQLSPIKKGNKIVGLDFLTTPNEKREKKYSLGLDVALPTPPQFATPIKGQKDAETTKRPRGRPPRSSYLTANPSRFSTGEMSNPNEF